MKNNQQLKSDGFKNIANGSVIIAFSILFYLIITILNNNFLDGLDLNTREEISKILKSLLIQENHKFQTNHHLIKRKVHWQKKELRF